MSFSSATTNKPLTGRGVGPTRELLQGRHGTVTENVQATLTAIQAADRRLGAYIATRGEPALREAERADRLIARLGEAAWRHFPLLGVTLSVKDLIQTGDLPTTRGSLLTNSRAPADAPAVARLRAAGAIVIGKTTTSEYGWSASTLSRVAEPTRNPWAPELTAGGSSGGAAAAVAAGLCSVALGTDGAGSVRIPAAFCGVVGFKPSCGRIPYIPPGASRLAHLGPITSSVADAAELMRILAGPDAGDPDSRAGLPAAPAAGQALRIGWIEFPGTSAEVRRVSQQVWPVLAAHGHRMECIPVPFGDPYAALVDLLAAEEAAATAPQDDQWCDQGRLEVVRYGRTLSAAAVIRAAELRTTLRARLWSVLERYDLLAMATVPCEPFRYDAIGPQWAADPADLLWLAWSPATYPFNLTGQPALSIPAGTTAAGLPVGVQLVGPLGGDELVLSAGRHIEAGLGLAMTPPDQATKGLSPCLPDRGQSAIKTAAWAVRRSSPSSACGTSVRPPRPSRSRWS